jgi:hypothetical protein
MNQRLTMRAICLTFSFAAFLAAALWADEPRLQTADKPPTACHGTAVEFVDTPVEAAKLAAQQKKLVFVLHVSGHFEDPAFT